jgi:hypothetical protein
VAKSLPPPPMEKPPSPNRVVRRPRFNPAVPARIEARYDEPRLLSTRIIAARSRAPRQAWAVVSKIRAYVSPPFPSQHTLVPIEHKGRIVAIGGDRLLSADRDNRSG